MVRLTKRTSDAQKPGDRDIFLWDDELPGFGLRVYPSGTKVYLLQWKRDGRSRRLKLGRHGPVTCEEARKAALAALVEVERGLDPAERRDDHKRDLTVAAMLELYLAEGAGHLKPGSREAYRSVFLRHVVPLLGARKLHTVTAADIAKLLDDISNGRTAREIEGAAKPRGRVIVRGGRGIAARTREYLGSAFSWAVRRGLVEATPCVGVCKPKTRRVERYLNADEFARLGAALARAEADGANPNFVAAVRLLMFTGCRRGEITGLRWSEVDLEAGVLRLADSKTGARLVPLPAAAQAVLAARPQGNGPSYVFPSSRGTGPIVGLKKFWNGICKRAGIEGATLHVLRHSLASTAVQQGASLFLVGKALGHTQAATTARYSHVHVDPVLAVVEAAAGRIAAAIAAGEAKARSEVGGEGIPMSPQQKRHA